MERKKEKSNLSHKDSNDLKKMYYTVGICSFFIICEIIGGLISNSLAILSDAAHLFSDLSGFIVSIIAMIIGKRKSNSFYTFGYHRAEVLGAFSSVVAIWIITIFLIQEAYGRLIHPSPIDSKIMLITAIIGLICNLSMMSVLHSSGHSHGVGCSHSHGHDNNHQHRHCHNHNHEHRHCHNNEHGEVNDHSQSHTKLYVISRSDIDSNNGSGDGMLELSKLFYN